ncbi:hypothetical protein ACA910_013514 [Epithemia clementina (nom. ined.)]
MSRLFELTDCPCNSLALNWMQMSCCMPQPAPDGNMNLFEAASAITSLDGEENRSPMHEEAGGAAAFWMEHLAKVAPNTKFRDLLVVGSHDSASCTISPSRPFSAVGRCQNLTVSEQLEAGIRLLDLRVGSHKGSTRHSDVCVWHGSLEGGPFFPILREIDIFVTDHPKEIVVLNLVPEFGVGFLSEQKLLLLKRIYETFGSRLIKASEMSDLMARWTLGDLINKGKQVLVLFHPRFCQDLKVASSSHAACKTSRDWTAGEIEAEFDVVNAEVWMRNLWFNTRNTEDLLKNVRQDISRHGNKKSHNLYCSQLVLTPGIGGLVDLMKALAGTNPLRPISLSQHLYKNQKLNNFLRSHATEPWNVFLLDFVDYCPWTVRFLTALNFPVPVKISLAVYQNGKSVLDLTDSMKKCICRGRVVFVTNIVQDLVLSESTNDCGSGSLVVAYSLGDKGYYVLTVPVVADAPLLMISYFATSANSVILIPWSNEGIIHGGQMLSSRASIRKLQGTVVRFKSTETKCTFDLIEE